MPGIVQAGGSLLPGLPDQFQVVIFPLKSSQRIIPTFFGSSFSFSGFTHHLHGALQPRSQAAWCQGGKCDFAKLLDNKSELLSP